MKSLKNSIILAYIYLLIEKDRRTMLNWVELC